MITKNISQDIVLKLNTKWKQNGVTIAGGNDLGKKLNQLSFPQGIFIDDNQTLYIADWWNDPTDMTIDPETNSLIITDCQNGRLMRYSHQNNTNGQIIISDIDCVSVTMDKDGSLFVSDCVRNEVRRWKRGEKDSTIVAGGNGQGDHLNQLNYPTFIFVDDDYSLYISDMSNHRVMKWLKDAQEGIIIDRFSQIYVADSLNHRVVRWCEGALQGTIIVGGNRQGQQSNQLNIPTGLSFDRENNLYVVDCFNHRVQKFEIE